MTETVDDEWRRYGETMIHSMASVLNEAPEEQHPLLLETADYWLSLGLAIGLDHRDDGRQLLHRIEIEEPNRTELKADAESFLKDVLG